MKQRRPPSNLLPTNENLAKNPEISRRPRSRFKQPPQSPLIAQPFARADMPTTTKEGG